MPAPSASQPAPTPAPAAAQAPAPPPAAPPPTPTPSPAAAPAPAPAPAQNAAPARPVTLPKVARPINYAVTITPDPDAMRFDATVRIEMQVLRPTQTITVNAADLDITSAAISGGPKASILVDPVAQTAKFTFDALLGAGVTTLELAYSGKINSQANGLFALDYKDVDGRSARALFTQLEPADGRRFVPGFDEPAYKATYDLTANVPAGQMAVGNMPVASRATAANGRTAVTFQRTPPMSSYLLFFAMGDLERIATVAGNVEVGVVTSRGQAGKGRFALDSAAEIVSWYTDYFGILYPLPKLDNVAAPGNSQFFGAMENWGAILTFENRLLNDPRISTPDDIRQIFSTAAHETAHQWFGDLVTMSWWDELWLNEGFASWLATKAQLHLYPEWEAELDRVDGREKAMALDGLATTHAIIQPVNSIDEIGAAFDTIAYNKGESVLAMLESFAREEVWRNGLTAYLKRHAYANTVTDDLWQAMEDSGAHGLIDIAHDFTRQPGVPLVRVASARCEGDSTLIALSQGEFSADRRAQTDASPRGWRVPVVARTIDGDDARSVIAGGRVQMILPGCGPVLVNAGQDGYFRTLYAPEQLAALRDRFYELPGKDQIGLATDALALARAGYQPMAAGLDTLAAIGPFASSGVQLRALDRWLELYRLLEGDGATQAGLAFAVGVRFGDSLTNLGFAPIAQEPLGDAALRAKLIGVLGAMGDPRILAEARRLFAALDANPAALDGPLRRSWLGVVAASADRATWDRLHAMAKGAATQLEREQLYGLLGTARDPALAQAALDLALTEEPGQTLSASIIARVAVGHADLATDFVLAHLDAVTALVDGSSIAAFVADLARESRDPAMTVKLRAYALDHLAETARTATDQAINKLEARARQEPAVRAGIRDWLAARPVG